MLTLFACPKAFTDPQTATIQRKAIQSWCLLQPRPQILLLGDEPGIAEVCKEFDLEHVPHLARTPAGTPLLSDVFQQAQARAKHPILAYVNADILISARLPAAIEKLAARWKKFLLVSSPHIVDFAELPIRPEWEAEAMDKILCAPTTSGADLFVFVRGVFRRLPPLIVGRLYWDEWLMSHAVLRHIPVIDGTRFVLTFHPRVAFTSHLRPHAVYYSPAEKAHNRRIVGSLYWMPRRRVPYFLDDEGHLHSRYGRFPVTKLQLITYILGFLRWVIGMRPGEG
ncbi:MAG: hypothetical protein NZ958_08285 [Bacteroidia bacterium]|nr:hypothetical protein [Bacteroidia bacterium]MDW8088520.1 hypothetical protein [Bacteroidia bacterium]